MSPDRPPLAFAGPSSRSGAVLALLSFVFFSRAWLIKVWGSPVPYWDEWDAQILKLIRPWLDGTFRWADLFAPHNEHRIVLTRVADLALFMASGKLDLWWQLLLNASLHAATAAFLGCLCWNAIPRPLRRIWLIGLAVFFVVPAGWQNALWGFQSQVFFCSLLSVLALGGLLVDQPLKLRWWLGWIAAALALLTVGSGVLAAITALLLSLYTFCAGCFSGDKPFSARSVFPLLALFILVVLGWSLRGEVPQHEPLRAHSLGQFSAVFFRCMSWPWVDSGWLWLVLQSPLMWLTVNALRCRTPPNSTVRFILSLGLLATLHAAAVAYTRGAGLLEARPLSRYQDPLLLSAVANLFILLKFAGPSRVGRIAALLWCGTMLAGLLTLTTTNLSLHLPFKRYQNTISLTQVRTYLATNDATVFNQEKSPTTLHPNVAVVRKVLDDPHLRPVLPQEFFDASIRPPWLIEYSPWLMLLSSVGLLLVTTRSIRPSKI